MSTIYYGDGTDDSITQNNITLQSTVPPSTNVGVDITSYITSPKRTNTFPKKIMFEAWIYDPSSGGMTGSPGQ